MSQKQIPVHVFETKKSEPIAVNVMGENISIAPSVEILDLTFSSDLSWHAHIEKKSPAHAKRFSFNKTTKAILGC